jgi:hypothetical protein
MAREVHVQTRRKFLQSLSASGAVLTGIESLAEPSGLSRDRSLPYSIPLREGWEFKLDDAGATRPSDTLDADAGWSPVQVPHTWQSRRVYVARFRLLVAQFGLLVAAPLLTTAMSDQAS